LDEAKGQDGHQSEEDTFNEDFFQCNKENEADQNGKTDVGKQIFWVNFFGLHFPPIFGPQVI